MSLLLVSYGSSDENSSDDNDEEDSTMKSKESHTSTTRATSTNEKSDYKRIPSNSSTSAFGEDPHISDEDDYIEMHKSADNDANNSNTTEICKNDVNISKGKEHSINGNRPANSCDVSKTVSDVSSFDYHISDEEEDILHSHSIGLNLPAPKAKEPESSQHTTNNSSAKIPIDADDQSQDLFLSALPKPKSSSGVDDTIEEAELEDIVKPKPAELLLKETVPKKGRRTVKITIPELPDSDDEDEPLKKKTKTTSKCGLFAMLPPPKNVSTKEANRPLIPHTLSKKPVAKVARPVATRTVTASSSAPAVGPLPVEPDSDNDEDDYNEESTRGNFFSLGDEEKPVLPSGVPINKMAAVQPATNDAPLSFTNARVGVTSHGDCHHTAPSGSGVPTVTDNVTYETAMESLGAEEFSEVNIASHKDGGLDIDEEQFIRLQGKRQRGREQIHIIDVHADDQRSEVEMTRTLTEETDPMLSHGHKKKDQPSQQQKRKHQITYLAFKAKEREFDLKNKWAEGRATRRQTQSKYGF